MSEFEVIPDISHPIVVGEEEQGIIYNGAYETMHYWEPMDIWWIRYFDAEEGKISMHVLPENGARDIFQQTDIPMVLRETIFKSEHDNLVQVMGMWATDEMFDLDIDVDAIEREELGDQ